MKTFITHHTNKIWAVLMLILSLFFTTSCTKKQTTTKDGSKDLLALIKEKGEITIATEGTWAPWTYHDESDKLVGFDVEIGQKIAEKLGVKAKFVEVEWDGIFAGIDSERYDITINGVEITEERSKKYNFSDPYAYVKTAIIVKGDRSDINSFEDLKGKKTANTLSSTYALLAESYGAITTGVDDINQTIELLLSDRIDATLNSEVSYYDYIKVHPESNLKIAALTEEASLVAIPVRKGTQNDALVTELNKAIKELNAEGELSKISLKYFLGDITKK